MAWVFMYSLDGLLADEGTEYWQFCFGLPQDPAETKQKIDLYESAYAHIMGRTTYEAMAGAERSTTSGRAATATSSSGAALACGGRSCDSI